MKQLNIDRINAKAPYKVSEDGKQLLFETRHGLHYEIRFFEEQPIGGCETWQFSFVTSLVSGTCLAVTMIFMFLVPPYFSRAPEMTICCTWLVPSKMALMRTSRYRRSMR